MHEICGFFGITAEEFERMYARSGGRKPSGRRCMDYWAMIPLAIVG